MLNVSTHFTLAFLISEILSFVKLTRKALFWFHILVEKNQKILELTYLIFCLNRSMPPFDSAQDLSYVGAIGVNIFTATLLIPFSYMYNETLQWKIRTNAE